MPGFTATERLFLTADRSRVVLEGDPEAAFLLAAPGQEIPADEARRLGLVDEEAPAEEKAVEGPPADKARKPRSTKKGR